MFGFIFRFFGIIIRFRGLINHFKPFTFKKKSRNNLKKAWTSPKVVFWGIGRSVGRSVGRTSGRSGGRPGGRRAGGRQVGGRAPWPSMQLLLCSHRQSIHSHPFENTLPWSRNVLKTPWNFIVILLMFGLLFLIFYCISNFFILCLCFLSVF